MIAYLVFRWTNADEGDRFDERREEEDRHDSPISRSEVETTMKRREEEERGET